MEPFVFRFITEDGVFEMTHEEYLKEENLTKKVRDRRRALLNLGKNIVSYDRKWLADARQAKKDFELLEAEQRKNPLRYFLPVCAAKGFDSAMHGFINDNIHTVCGCRAGNRTGKTTGLYIKQLTVRGAIPTKPHWEIHSEHGVKWREWDGPKTIGLSTYQMINHQNTIWPLIIQAWTPEDQLGDYRRGGKRWPNFQNNPHVPLNCDSKFYLNAASQGQNVFESDARDGWGWDEQGDEDNFNGAEFRTATCRWWYEDEEMIQRLGSGWHDLSLTPHKLKDRPDTGAGTYIHRMETGEDSKNLSNKFYQASVIYDTPDWVYSEIVKQQKLEEWIHEPLRNGNMRKYREGRARMFGEYHSSSGLVYEDWDRSVHMIDPFPIPPDWTRYRGVDHGLKNPMACLFAAVSPKGDIVIYDEYVAVNRLVDDNVAAIIKKAGNERVERLYESVAVNQALDNSGMKTYKELQCSQRFRWTVMDGRSFSKPSDMTRYTLGDIYRMAGLSVMPAKGVANEYAFPIVSEAFRIDPDRTHIQSGKRGAPRLYVFNTLVHLPRGIEHYTYKESPTGKETAVKKDDHEVDALKYLILSGPKYVPGFSSRLEKRYGRRYRHQRRQRGDQFTRY